MVMLMCQNETCITKFDTNNMLARYPCCSIECFREWENDLNHKSSRMMESPLECQSCKKESCICKPLDGGVGVDSGVWVPSLKDFIGKECNIFGVGDDDMPMWNSGVTLSNVQRGGNLETHHFIYMGSDDSCHIIQRKIDGEPDGIFFFPKAAVALRF